jgi:Na+/H+ antiporter NhaD/arsenite permease-like protein
VGPYWLLAAAPAILIFFVSHYLSYHVLFSAEADRPLDKAKLERQLKDLGHLKKGEILSLAGFLFFLFGAATVSLHHIAPAWIAGIVLLGLLLSGQLSKVDFRRQLDWPMIFFLLGMDSVTQVMNYLGLNKALAETIGPWYSLVQGNIGFYIVAALLTTLVIRLALPVTAGMLVSFFILLPVAEAQGIHPWIAVFLTAMFSDIWFFPYQSSVYLQAESQGTTEFIQEKDFFRYNGLINLSRVVAAYASIPYWKWLGIL